MAPASQSRLSGVSARPAAAPALTAGVDIGTTAVKAVVVDPDGNVVERARLASALAVGAGGRLEHDAVATWWEGPRRALAQALMAHDVRAVAVSAMMPSVGAVDGRGRPLGPGLLYGDGRGSYPASPAPGGDSDGGDPTAGDPTAGDPTAGDPTAGDPTAGDPTAGDPTGSDEMERLTAWAASEFPDASGYWPAQAVANSSLAGEGVVDLASAFAAGPLFGASGWDEDVCRRAGVLPGQMPRIVMFGEAVGRLPGTGTILGAGSVDGLCEQLVAGAVEDGDVLVALGSTLVVWLCVPGWPGEVPGLWRVPHFVAGKAMVGGASNAGGIWVDWVDRLIRPASGASRTGTAHRSSRLDAGERPGDVPLWWPWARGERVPWHDRSLRIGMGSADISHGPATLRRAAFEASGFVARHIVERASLCGTVPRRVIVSGGGTANPAWVQALADVLGRQVLPVVVPETAALGAAFLARVASGAEASLDGGLRWARWQAPVEPRRDWVAAASARYQQWCQALPSTPG